MEQETFSLDGLEKGTPVDISLLTDDGRNFYRGLCQELGLESLPSDGNEKEINKIADKSYYNSFMNSLRGWLTPSLIDRISKGLYDYMLLLRKLTTYNSHNAMVNKDTYKARFDDPTQFHRHHKGDIVYDRLCEFMDTGGIGIDNHLKEIDEIINKGFSIEEIEDAIDDCKKNNETVYNIKYLHSILKRMKEDEAIDKKRWQNERRDSIACIESLKIEETLNQRELTKKRKLSKEEESMLDNILSLRRNDGKTET
jgi:DNA-binding transcriptional MerR regulator